MKLQNKKTGMIGELGYLATSDGKIIVNNINDQDEWYEYGSLSELNKEWEDYEEPTTYYYISDFGAIREGDVGKFVEDEIARKEIGNYFETKEEAEKAVEKLKAWKRLKNGGITFKNWTINQTGTIDCFATWGDNIPPSRKDPTLQEDLDLLFGGEE